MTKSVLITGVSGFIGLHLALEFLTHGYSVRGTVRDDSKADLVRDALRAHCDVDGLDFAAADLGEDAGWDEAAKGIDHVVHAASPFPMSQPKQPGVLVRPAVDGTMRVLHAAIAAGAASFVQTSSIAAIYPGHGQRNTPYTPADWANLGSRSATPYVMSKTLAERSARDFIAKEKPDIRYASVNPGFVLGPPLGAPRGTSAEIISMFLNGKYPGVPRVQMTVVDVRDVAAAHRLAIECGAANGRYIASAGSLWLKEMAAILHRNLGAGAAKVPTRQLPDALIRLLGFFSPSVRMVVPELGRPLEMDVSSTTGDLGLTFRSPEEAVVAMAKSVLAAERR